MAGDNFSHASSHLIYDVAVMEETCADSRISDSIESGEESPRTCERVEVSSFPLPPSLATRQT